jgi:succinyl-CoA synthetase beta subunit
MNIYIAIEYSRIHGGPVIRYSQHGGLSLDRITREYPEDLYTIKPDLLKGLKLADLLEIGENLGIHEHQHKLLFVVRNMWELFIVRDCTFL